MPRAYFSKAVIRRVSGAPADGTVAVYKNGTITPLSQIVYAADTGTTALPQPFNFTNGLVEFFLDLPERVRLVITPTGSPSQTFDNVDVRAEATITGRFRSDDVNRSALVLDSFRLPDAAGSTANGDVLFFPTGGSDVQLRTRVRRTATGTNHDTTALDIYRLVDVTEMGRISFAPSGEVILVPQLTAGNRVMLHAPGGVAGWEFLAVKATTLWGDGVADTVAAGEDAAGGNRYVTLGAGGYSGIMLNHPHVVWHSGSAGSYVRLGRFRGKAGGHFWDAGFWDNGDRPGAFEVRANGAGGYPTFFVSTSGSGGFGGFDLVLGAKDQTSRGNTGLSRALVKNSGGRLDVNFAGDFTGGVYFHGNGSGYGAIFGQPTRHDAPKGSICIDIFGITNGNPTGAEISGYVRWRGDGQRHAEDTWHAGENIRRFRTTGAALFDGWQALHAGSFTTNSNEANKTDVKTLDVTSEPAAGRRGNTRVPPMLDRIKSLRAVSFKPVSPRMDGEPDPNVPTLHSFIAEEIVKVLPEAVSVNSDGKPEGINLTSLSTITMAVVQELLARNEALAARVARLESASPTPPPPTPPKS